MWFWGPVMIQQRTLIFLKSWSATALSPTWVCRLESLKLTACSGPLAPSKSAWSWGSCSLPAWLWLWECLWPSPPSLARSFGKSVDEISSNLRTLQWREIKWPQSRASYANPWIMKWNGWFEWNYYNEWNTTKVPIRALKTNKVACAWAGVVMQVGRCSNAGGKRQKCRWAEAEMQVRLQR